MHKRIEVFVTLAAAVVAPLLLVAEDRRASHAAVVVAFASLFCRSPRDRRGERDSTTVQRQRLAHPLTITTFSFNPSSISALLTLLITEIAKSEANVIASTSTRRQHRRLGWQQQLTQQQQ